MMKLQRDDKRDNYKPHGLSKVGREEEMDIPEERVGLPRFKILSSQNQDSLLILTIYIDQT